MDGNKPSISDSSHIDPLSLLSLVSSSSSYPSSNASYATRITGNNSPNTTDNNYQQSKYIDESQYTTTTNTSQSTRSQNSMVKIIDIQKRPKRKQHSAHYDDETSDTLTSLINRVDHTDTNNEDDEDGFLSLNSILDSRQEDTSDGGPAQLSLVGGEVDDEEEEHQQLSRSSQQNPIRANRNSVPARTSNYNLSYEQQQLPIQNNQTSGSSARNPPQSARWSPRVSSNVQQQQQQVPSPTQVLYNNNNNQTQRNSSHHLQHQKQQSGDTLSSFESDYDLLVYLGETETEDIVETERSCDYQDQTWRQSICGGASLAPTIDESLSELIGNNYNLNNNENNQRSSDFDLLNTPTQFSASSSPAFPQHPAPPQSSPNHSLNYLPSSSGALVISSSSPVDRPYQQTRSPRSSSSTTNYKSFGSSTTGSGTTTANKRSPNLNQSNAKNKLQRSELNTESADECDNEVSLVFDENLLDRLNKQQAPWLSSSNQTNQNDSNNNNNNNNNYNHNYKQDKSSSSIGNKFVTLFNKKPNTSTSANRGKEEFLVQNYNQGNQNKNMGKYPMQPTYNSKQSERLRREQEAAGMLSLNDTAELDRLLAEMSQSLDLDSLARYDPHHEYYSSTSPSGVVTASSSTSSGLRVGVPSSDFNKPTTKTSQTLSKFHSNHNNQMVSKQPQQKFNNQSANYNKSAGNLGAKSLDYRLGDPASLYKKETEYTTNNTASSSVNYLNNNNNKNRLATDWRPYNSTPSSSPIAADKNYNQESNKPKLNKMIEQRNITIVSGGSPAQQVASSESILDEYDGASRMLEQMISEQLLLDHERDKNNHKRESPTKRGPVVVVGSSISASKKRELLKRELSKTAAYKDVQESSETDDNKQLMSDDSRRKMSTCSSSLATDISVIPASSVKKNLNQKNKIDVGNKVNTNNSKNEDSSSSIENKSVWKHRRSLNKQQAKEDQDDDDHYENQKRAITKTKTTTPPITHLARSTRGAQIEKEINKPALRMCEEQYKSSANEKSNKPSSLVNCDSSSSADFEEIGIQIPPPPPIVDYGDEQEVIRVEASELPITSCSSSDDEDNNNKNANEKFSAKQNNYNIKGEGQIDRMKRRTLSSMRSMRNKFNDFMTSGDNDNNNNNNHKSRWYSSGKESQQQAPKPPQRSSSFGSVRSQQHKQDTENKEQEAKQKVLADVAPETTTRESRSSKRRSNDNNPTNSSTSFGKQIRERLSRSKSRFLDRFMKGKQQRAQSQPNTKQQALMDSNPKMMADELDSAAKYDGELFQPSDIARNSEPLQSTTITNPLKRNKDSFDESLDRHLAASLIKDKEMELAKQQQQRQRKSSAESSHLSGLEETNDSSKQARRRQRRRSKTNNDNRRSTSLLSIKRLSSIRGGGSNISRDNNNDPQKPPKIEDLDSMKVSTTSEVQPKAANRTKKGKRGKNNSSGSNNNSERQPQVPKSNGDDYFGPNLMIPSTSNDQVKGEEETTFKVDDYEGERGESEGKGENNYVHPIKKNRASVNRTQSMKNIGGTSPIIQSDNDQNLPVNMAKENRTVSFSNLNNVRRLQSPNLNTFRPLSACEDVQTTKTNTTFVDSGIEALEHQRPESALTPIPISNRIETDKPKQLTVNADTTINQGKEENTVAPPFRSKSSVGDMFGDIKSKCNELFNQATSPISVRRSNRKQAQANATTTQKETLDQHDEKHQQKTISSGNVEEISPSPPPPTRPPRKRSKSVGVTPDHKDFQDEEDANVIELEPTSPDSSLAPIESLKSTQTGKQANKLTTFAQQLKHSAADFFTNNDQQSMLNRRSKRSGQLPATTQTAFVTPTSQKTKSMTIGVGGKRVVEPNRYHKEQQKEVKRSEEKDLCEWKPIIKINQNESNLAKRIPIIGSLIDNNSRVGSGKDETNIDAARANANLPPLPATSTSTSGQHQQPQQTIKRAISLRKQSTLDTDSTWETSGDDEGDNNNNQLLSKSYVSNDDMNGDEERQQQANLCKDESQQESVDLQQLESKEAQRNARATNKRGGLNDGNAGLPATFPVGATTAQGGQQVAEAEKKKLLSSGAKSGSEASKTTTMNINAKQQQQQQQQHEAGKFELNNNRKEKDDLLKSNKKQHAENEKFDSTEENQHNEHRQRVKEDKQRQQLQQVADGIPLKLHSTTTTTTTTTTTNTITSAQKEQTNTNTHTKTSKPVIDQHQQHKRLDDVESNATTITTNKSIKKNYNIEQKICKTPFKFNANLPSPAQLLDAEKRQAHKLASSAVAGPHSSNSAEASTSTKQKDYCLDKIIKSDANLAALLSAEEGDLIKQQQQQVPAERGEKEGAMTAASAAFASQQPDEQSAVSAKQSSTQVNVYGVKPNSINNSQAQGDEDDDDDQATSNKQQNRLSIYDNVSITTKTPSPTGKPVSRKPPPCPPHKPAHLLLSSLASADTAANNKRDDDIQNSGPTSKAKPLSAKTPSSPSSPTCWSLEEDEENQHELIANRAPDPGALATRLKLQQEQIINESKQAQEQEEARRGQVAEVVPKRKLVTMTSIIQDPNDELMNTSVSKSTTSNLDDDDKKEDLGKFEIQQQQQQQEEKEQQTPLSKRPKSVGQITPSNSNRRDSTFSYDNDNNNSTDSDSSFAAAAINRKRLISKFEQASKNDDKSSTQQTRPKFPAFNDGKSAITRATPSSSSLVKRMAKNFDQTIQEHAADQKGSFKSSPLRSSLEQLIGNDEQKSEASWYDAKSIELLDEAEVEEFLRDFDTNLSNPTATKTTTTTTKKGPATSGEDNNCEKKKNNIKQQRLTLTELSDNSATIDSVSTGLDPFVTVAESTIEEDKAVLQEHKSGNSSCSGSGNDNANNNDNTLNDDDTLNDEEQLEDDDEDGSNLVSAADDVNNEGDNDNDASYRSSRSTQQESTASSQTQKGNDKTLLFKLANSNDNEHSEIKKAAATDKSLSSSVIDNSYADKNSPNLPHLATTTKAAAAAAAENLPTIKTTKGSPIETKINATNSERPCLAESVVTKKKDKSVSRVEVSAIKESFEIVDDDSATRVAPERKHKPPPPPPLAATKISTATTGTTPPSTNKPIERQKMMTMTTMNNNNNNNLTSNSKPATAATNAAAASNKKPANDASCIETAACCKKAPTTTSSATTLANATVVEKNQDDVNVAVGGCYCCDDDEEDLGSVRESISDNNNTSNNSAAVHVTLVAKQHTNNNKPASPSPSSSSYVSNTTVTGAATEPDNTKTTTTTTSGGQLIDNSFKNSLNNIIARRSSQPAQQQEQQQIVSSMIKSSNNNNNNNNNDITDDKKAQLLTKSKSKMTTNHNNTMTTKINNIDNDNNTNKVEAIKCKELKGLSKYCRAILKHSRRKKKKKDKKEDKATSDNKDKKKLVNNYTQLESSSSSSTSTATSTVSSPASSDDEGDEEREGEQEVDNKELVRAAKKCSRLYEELERILADRAAKEQLRKNFSKPTSSAPKEKASSKQTQREGIIIDINDDNNQQEGAGQPDEGREGEERVEEEEEEDPEEFGSYYDLDRLSSMTEREDQISLSSSSVSSESIPEIRQRQNLQKLYYVVNEIYSSEAKFVDTLKLLNVDFRQHMLKCSNLTNTSSTSLNSNHSSSLISSDMETSISSNNSHSHKSHKNSGIPIDCLSSILKHLPQLQALNENLLAELKQARDQWPKTQKIAHVLVKIGPFLKHYSTYIREFELMSQQLQETIKKYPLFAERLKEFESSERSQKLTIQHHLLKPIQRIPQYRLLLQQYLHYLKPDDVDYEDTVSALEVVSRVAEHANQSMNEGANFAKLLALQAKIVGKQKNIVQPGRLFVKEGELLKVCRKQIQPRWFVLLNDVLLYLTQIQSSDILYLNNELPLDDCSVSIPNTGRQMEQQCQQDERQQTAANDTNTISEQVPTVVVANSEHSDREFNVCFRTRAFTLIAKTQAERDDWVQTFRQTIDDHMARRRSFSVRQQQLAAAAASENSSQHSLLGIEESQQLSTSLSASGKDLLGQKAPLWTPDSRVTMCQLCTSSFSAIFRRHHCRACGRVVCSACSSNKAPLIYLKCRSARVCDQCFEILKSNIHLYYLPTSSSGTSSITGRSLDNNGLPVNEQELKRLDELFRILLKSQFVKHAKLHGLSRLLKF